MALNSEKKQQIIKEFAQSAGDTGSTDVQIAVLTTNIRELTGHCKKHPHDFSSRRGLVQMVCDRRGFLRYLERTDRARYKNIIERLGLKK